MTALVSFERVFEVLDLPSLIQEKPDAVALPEDAGRLEFDHVAFTYPRADEVSLASLEAVARVESRDHVQVLHDVSLRRRARADGRAGRPLGCRQDDDHPPGGAALRRRRGRRPGRWPRRPRRDPPVAGGRRRLRHPGRPHVPRHDPGQPALRQPRRQRPRDLGRPRGRPDRDPGPRRCPTGSTPWSATAATASPAASGSGWRSPGCCSRRPRSWSSTRPPPTSTPSRRLRSSAPSTPHSRAAPRWSSHTGSPRCATPTRSSSSTAAGSSSPAPTPSCSTPAGSTPTSTAPSSSTTFRRVAARLLLRLVAQDPLGQHDVAAPLAGRAVADEDPVAAEPVLGREPAAALGEPEWRGAGRAELRASRRCDSASAGNQPRPTSSPNSGSRATETVIPSAGSPRR